MAISPGGIIFPADVFAAFFSAVDAQTFTAGGTWNKPAGAKWLRVQVLGGGAGGGGAAAAAASQHAAGAGGGAGGYAEIWLPASSVGASETVTVGTGGAGGGAGNNVGIGGGSSSFGSLCAASGGAGGAGGASSAASFGVLGGLGGIGTVGTILSRGGSASFSYGDASLACSSNGADSMYGGGALGWALSSAPASNAGRNADGYGAGGSGACVSAGGAAAAGGNGKSGLVIVTTFI